MNPVTIKYRDGKHQTVTIKADRCSGEVPAYSNTYYCIFYLKGTQVARVAQSRLLPGYYKKYSQLFGRPWLEKITNATEIRLMPFDDGDEKIGGYPNDTERVWTVNDDEHTWVIECAKCAILHVMNNDDQTFKGDFKTALKRMFPNKKVTLYYRVTYVSKVEL